MIKLHKFVLSCMLHTLFSLTTWRSASASFNQYWLLNSLLHIEVTYRYRSVLFKEVVYVSLTFCFLTIIVILLDHWNQK